MKAVVVRLSREQLEQERDSILEMIGDCTFSPCPHHDDLRFQLESVEWLLLGVEDK